MCTNRLAQKRRRLHDFGLLFARIPRCGDERRIEFDQLACDRFGSFHAKIDIQHGGVATEFRGVGRKLVYGHPELL